MPHNEKGREFFPALFTRLKLADYRPGYGVDGGSGAGNTMVSGCARVPR
jgi:hypothetical protein